jgi:hypothetical protein
VRSVVGADDRSEDCIINFRATGRRRRAALERDLSPSCRTLHFQGGEVEDGKEPARDIGERLICTGLTSLAAAAAAAAAQQPERGHQRTAGRVPGGAARLILNAAHSLHQHLGHDVRVDCEKERVREGG